MTQVQPADLPFDATRLALDAHIDQEACTVFTIRQGKATLTDREIASLMVSRSNFTAAGVLRAAADRGMQPHELYSWADDVQLAGEVAAQLGFEG